MDDDGKEVNSKYCEDSPWRIETTSQPSEPVRQTGSNYRPSGYQRHGENGNLELAKLLSNSATSNSQKSERGMNGRKRKERHPDKFNGTIDLADYLNHFDRVARGNTWNREEKAMQLSMSLTGEAQGVCSFCCIFLLSVAEPPVSVTSVFDSSRMGQQSWRHLFWGW